MSIFLSFAGVKLIAGSNHVSGFLILVLGLVLFPKISEIIKKEVGYFQNKKSRYTAYALLFLIAIGSLGRKQGEVSKKEVFVSYLKKENQDIPIENLRKLEDFIKMFRSNCDDFDSSIVVDDYITERVDSVKKVSVITFKPKLFCASQVDFLKNDSENGFFKDYSLEYEVDEKNNVKFKMATISYTKAIRKYTKVDGIPSAESFIDEKALKLRKSEIVIEKRVAEEKRKFNAVMGNDDFWNKYNPLLKKRIYKMILDKNCGELQESFTNAANMADLKHSRGGKANKEVALMDFLDEKMKELGCYNR